MSRALAWRLTPVAADRLTVAGLAIWALFDVPWWWRPPGHGGSNLEIGGLVALAAVQSLPFLWRRRQPAVVLAVTAAALGVKFGAHLNLWSASAAVLTAAYGLGAYGSRTLRIISRVMVALAVVAAIVTLQAIDGNHTTAIACALFATALAVGEITAAHRDLITSLARQAYDDELASLAREVHDVVAHQLSAIAVQAGAARFAAAGDPGAAVTAIASIEQGAREGLEELNALVQRMRQTDGAEGFPAAGARERRAGSSAAAQQDAVRRADDAPCSRPRLDDVPGLITRARQAGLQAELTIDGGTRPLADAVELAAYRVVQEGLTNAIRYAAGGAAIVRLRYSDSGILIEVADDGPASLGGRRDNGVSVNTEGAGLSIDAGQGETELGGGAGLAGLRERARLLGGRFEAGSCHQGFVVRAFLPSR
ncbi:MAG: sensor histidine kinase [Streptosporangiaceae bacterium]